MTNSYRWNGKTGSMKNEKWRIQEPDPLLNFLTLNSSLLHFVLSKAVPMNETATSNTLPVKWAKVIDHTKCIGCHACSTACKSENQVPVSVQRTYVKYVDVGVFPQVRRAFQVTRCNQCA